MSFLYTQIHHILLRLATGITIVIILPLLFSCKHSAPSQTDQHERISLDSLAATYTSVDSLRLLQKNMEREGNTTGSMIVQRHIGNLLRLDNHFSQALQIHSDCQSRAQAANDKLEWIQATNEIGTDYRRVCIFCMALQYHYRALMTSNSYADTSYIARKCKAAALNGLGNAYLALHNYSQADSLLKLALAEEKAMNSISGIATNYANLGSAYARCGKQDSAWIFYKKAMYYNQKAHNVMGISLCHTYFGSLCEQEGKDQQALQEYQTAYQMMEKSKDAWYILPSLIALAKYYVHTSQWTDASHYLASARDLGEKNHLTEYLVDIYSLYYHYYKQQGDYRNALLFHEKAKAEKDSLIDEGRIDHIQSVSLNIVEKANDTLRQERSSRQRAYTIFVIILEVLIAAFIILLYSHKLRKQTMKGMQRVADLREDFFTNIAHEFRTPLTVILGLTRSMQNDSHTLDSTKEKAKTIERQSNAILTIINQVISSKMLPAVVKDDEWRHGNISLFMEMIAQSYQDIAEHKGINYHFIKEEEIEMDFVPGYAAKIMNTLLAYAFKYTSKNGTVTATVSREKDTLHLTVSDTGIGMPPEVANKVFTPYFLEEGNIKDIDTCIGLSTVKQIVDLAKGNITLQSDLGKGTTIRVTLPIHSDYALSPDTQQATAQVEEKTEEELPSNTHSQEKLPHLLVIEDNNDMANFISSIFTGQCDLSFSTDGNEGLQMAMDSIPDLIIIDRSIKRVDGLELCRQIRSNPVINHIPIIMITAKVTEQDQLECAKTGIAVCLSKPFTAEMLRTHVGNLLKGRDLMLKKFAEIYEERKVSPVESASLQTAANLQFLHKVTDTIYLLIGRRKEVTVAALASKMCMSTSQFYRKMVAMTGMTPTAYIQRARIKKAMNLIDSRQGISLADVADQCGFDAYPNFVRSFKNVCGITPTDYRRGIDTKK